MTTQMLNFYNIKPRKNNLLYKFLNNNERMIKNNNLFEMCVVCCSDIPASSGVTQLWITCKSTFVKVKKFSMSIADANLLNIMVGKMAATYV